ncbi:MAG: hypothetical protein OXH00_03400 [Candidatus Poribacteria bacterium]|nr:hypothetical protein [Candidatus Poribacteria bacterium]
MRNALLPVVDLWTCRKLHDYESLIPVGMPETGSLQQKSMS